MIIKREQLIETLLKRVEYADDKFIGYDGDKYIYILDLEVSQRYGYIKNYFWVLNKINETDFLLIPNKGDGFVFSTHQEDNQSFIDINRNQILLDGEQRLTEFSKNIDGFAPILSEPIFNTIQKYLGNH
jgi:hypothetical protein